MKSKELTANAAATLAGWRKKPAPLTELKRAWHRASHRPEPVGDCPVKPDQPLALLVDLILAADGPAQKRLGDRRKRGIADGDLDHAPLLALRTPATPSWLIRTPFRLHRVADRPQRPSLRPHRHHLADRLLLGLVRDRLAALAAPEAERNDAAEIATPRPLVGLHLSDAFADAVPLGLGESSGGRRGCSISFS